MYEDSLIAMEHFLQKVGEKHWLKWIKTDLEEWIKSRNVSHHLSAYGGMGSFNDVIISSANNHFIPAVTESWVDPLFSWLKSLCFFFAKNPEKEFSLSELRSQIGYHDASLAAFVGGESAPIESRGLSNNTTPIQGWRCLECGYSELSESDLNYFAAQTIVPEIVFEACVSKSLIAAIDNILSLNIPNLEKSLNELRNSIKVSGIELKTRDGWMRPCPSCNSDDTAVYRWLYSEVRFSPSTENLKMKAKKKWWQI
jgi:hypothetical protein